VTLLAAKAPLASPTFTGTVTHSGRVVITPDSASVASAHVAIDASLGNVWDVSCTANFTLDNPTNPSDGQVLHIRFTQDATGSRTITLGTAWNAGGNTITLTTTANKCDHMVAQYSSARSKWDITGFIGGF
jgi:NADPH-dependent curcumin reductase CurA